MTLSIASLLLAVTLIPLSPSHASFKSIELEMFSAIAAEMERLDAEALLVRANRPTPWKVTVEQLHAELSQSTDQAGLAIALGRLDQAYPNLHSFSNLGAELSQSLPRRLTPLVRFSTDWLSESQTRFRVSKVEPGLSIPADSYPVVGDEIIAINGKAMAYWSDVNFDFCKHPLRSQCDTLMSEKIIGRLLPWTQHQPLSYTLNRAGRHWTIAVPIVEAPAKPHADPTHLECGNAPARYKGFIPTYIGRRLCVYESTHATSTAIMRITSFTYPRLPEGHAIPSLEQELITFYPWWKAHGTFEHLVIDLIDNGGGNAPIPYYQVLFGSPFQEQYFRLKKSPEIIEERIRKGIFWGSTGLEVWFQDILKSGIFSATATGGLLPPVPMFCPDESKNCSDGLFDPWAHPFTGKISVLLNEWCVSSCDGFAYAIQEHFGARAKFYGHPQAADTAFARMTIHAFLDPAQPKGFTLKVRPIRTEMNPAPYFSQTVSVSRSVTADGTVVSGIPVPLDGFIAETLENHDRWVQTALDAALK